MRSASKFRLTHRTYSYVSSCLNKCFGRISERERGAYLGMAYSIPECSSCRNLALSCPHCGLHMTFSHVHRCSYSTHLYLLFLSLPSCNNPLPTDKIKVPPSTSFITSPHPHTYTHIQLYTHAHIQPHTLPNTHTHICTQI